MRRRRFLAACAAFWLPGELLAQARVPRIGYLVLMSLAETPSRERQAFLDGLREHGRVPGKGVEIVYRSAEGEPEFLDAACAELLKLKPDVLVVSGALSVLAAKRATRSVPIVMLAVGDPVGIGAVASLSKSGGNITGVSFISSELAPKRLQLARELVPRARRLAVLWDRRNDNARAEAAATLAAAKTLGMAAEPASLASDAELARSLARLAANKPDLLYVVFEGGLVAGNRTTLAGFGLRERLPLVSGWSFLTEAGGLISYAPDIPSMFRRAAYHVDRVLAGAAASGLPIELPTKIELVLNLRTAKALGLKVPPEMLVRADRVIE